MKNNNVGGTGSKPETDSKWIPHNYQLQAISFLLSNPRSGLFLDPG